MPSRDPNFNDMQPRFTLANHKNYPSAFKKIFKEFLLAHIVKIRSARYSHVFSQIKTSQTVFENGHQRNISAKFS